MLAGGSIALAAHGTKATARLAINASPEPFSNWTASVTEDVAVLGGIWMIFNHPLVMLILVIAFMALGIWIVPKIFRFAKRGFTALRNRCAAASRINRAFRRRPATGCGRTRLVNKQTPWNIHYPATVKRASSDALNPRRRLRPAPNVSRSLVGLEGLGQTEQKHILANATALFGAWRRHKAEPTGLFSLLGHKGDLMLVHFRSIGRPNHAELSLTQCELYRISRADHFLSFRGRAGTLRSFGETLRGADCQRMAARAAADWNSAVEAELVKQREACRRACGPRFRNAAICVFIR